MRVLIADRQSLYRNGLRHLLRGRLGAASVSDADHLDQAVEMLARGHFDIAFFDPDLPGVGGPAGLAPVKSSHPDLKVIVLSHDVDQVCAMETLEAGLDGCLPRGLSGEQIAEALRLVRAGHVFIPQSIVSSSLKAATLAPNDKDSLDLRPSDELSHRPITARQFDVLRCIVRGLSNGEISRELQIANGTVKIHLGTLFDVFAVRNRTELALRARTEFPELG